MLYNYYIFGGVMDKIKVLYTEEEIAARVKELAETLYETYKDEEVVFVCTLKGAVFFACDLLKRFVILSSFTILPSCM